MKPEDVPTREELEELIADNFDNPFSLLPQAELALALDRLYTALTALSDEKLKRQQAEHERDCILETLAACRAELEASRKNEARLFYMAATGGWLCQSRDGDLWWLGWPVKDAEGDEPQEYFQSSGFNTPEEAIDAAIDQARKDKT